MNIFKKFFGSPPPPSHTSKVFVKWSDDGKEYGPYELEQLLSRSWSGPPKAGKLSGEKKWKPYGEIFALLNQIEPSEEQKKTLEKLKVTTEPSSYSHAHELIVSAKKKKKEATDRLPATKATLEKLQQRGIKYDDTITRSEAKGLLKAQDDQNRKEELLEQAREIGIKLPSKITLEELEALDGATLPSEESLSELKALCRTLDSWKVKYTLPKIYTQDSVDDAIDIYDEAINEAEGAVEEVKQGFLQLEHGDYGLDGIEEDADFTIFMSEIARRALKENWDFEKNVRSLIRKHFPNAKFEKID